MNAPRSHNEILAAYTARATDMGVKLAQSMVPPGILQGMPVDELEAWINRVLARLHDEFMEIDGAEEAETRQYVCLVHLALLQEMQRIATNTHVGGGTA